MSCGCIKPNDNGKAVVDFVRGKGKDDMPTLVEHTIECSCGQTFIMKKAVNNCPHCSMTYGVTPCSSDDIKNIRAAGIQY